MDPWSEKNSFGRRETKGDKKKEKGGQEEEAGTVTNKEIWRKSGNNQ